MPVIHKSTVFRSFSCLITSGSAALFLTLNYSLARKQIYSPLSSYRSAFRFLNEPHSPIFTPSNQISHSFFLDRSAEHHILLHISFCLCRSHPAILLYRSENPLLPSKMRLVLTWPRLFLPGSPPHPARAKLVLTSPRVLPSRIATSPGQNKACFDLATGTALPDRHHSRPEQSLLCSCRRHCLPGSPPHPARTKLALFPPQALPSRPFCCIIAVTLTNPTPEVIHVQLSQLRRAHPL